jgi:hypothetical protein
MKRQDILILIWLCLVLNSCNFRTENKSLYDDLIEGEWIQVKNSIDTISYDSLWKCMIFKNKQCKIYPGFYDYKIFDWVQINYLGNTTSYKIDSNSVKIYNLVKHQWDELKIKKLSRDSLILNYPTNIEYLYIKSTNKEKFKQTFDEIILLNESIGKYRTDYKIILSKNSKAQIQAYNFNNKSIGKKNCIIESKLTDSIFSLFNHVNITSLKNEYSPVDDNNFNYDSKQITTVAFVKNNKVIKEVQIIDDSGPLDLHLAYEPIRSIFDLNRSECKIAVDNEIYSDFNSSIYTCDEKKYYDLLKTESYLIKMKINKAKEIKGRIKDIYKFKSDFHFIFSDGRFIRKEGSEKIYDVGYQFIDSTRLKMVVKEEAMDVY